MQSPSSYLSFRTFDKRDRIEALLYFDNRIASSYGYFDDRTVYIIELNGNDTQRAIQKRVLKRVGYYVHEHDSYGDAQVANTLD